MGSLADDVARSAAGKPPKKDPFEGEVVNRVADSAIETFDLEQFWDGAEIVEFDLAPFLFHGLIVKEREFREHVRAYDWSSFAGQHVAVHCSADTIIPTWAFMLVCSRLEPHASSTSVGRKDDLSSSFFAAALEAFDFSPYEDRIVVVKGCNSGVVPVSAYADAMTRLQDVARKIMFGEACSSVPLWRKK